MTVATVIANARALRKPAQSVAAVLAFVDPRGDGRTWCALCAWCLEKSDPHEEGETHRMAEHVASDCYACSYTGPDVLVAAVFATRIGGR